MPVSAGPASSVFPYNRGCQIHLHIFDHIDVFRTICTVFWIVKNLETRNFGEWGTPLHFFKYMFKLISIHIAYCSGMCTSYLPKVRTWHLSRLNLSNHFSDQPLSESISYCNMCASSLEVIWRNNLTSSANRSASDVIASAKSFMYITNNNVPKTLPCGIPLNTGVDSESAPFTFTTWLLYPIKDISIKTIRFQLDDQPTVGHSVERLSEVKINGNYSASINNCSSWVVVDLPLINPYCLDDKSFTSIMWFIIASLTKDSSHLQANRAIILCSISSSLFINWWHACTFPIFRYLAMLHGLI